MTFRNSTWFPEGCSSGHERLPASLRGTSTKNRDHNNPRAPHNDPRAPQDIQGTLRKSRSQVPRPPRANGPRPRATSQRSPVGLNDFFNSTLSQANFSLKKLSTSSPHPSSVQPFAKAETGQNRRKITRYSGLGTFGSAHDHLDLPLRSPMNPTSHRAVVRASVPSRFPATTPSPGSPTRDIQPESCDSHGRFSDSFPRASRLGMIRNNARDPPKPESGQGGIRPTTLVGVADSSMTSFGVAVGLFVVPKSILGIVRSYAPS
ncbi:hypothetical protein CRG98_002872 [Punica granatum]|uniref:Uncharacterized protein n=1 Tax=Punica granatum TaxID=22663 RepID=A0A2I0L7S3_PUNGR|nr:hypothetical protein CRG98_002872 [Punica granatum]